MISFCSRRVRLRFSLRRARILRFSAKIHLLCPFLDFCISAFLVIPRLSPVERSISKNPHKKRRLTRTMSKFENVLKAQKVIRRLRAPCYYSSRAASISRVFFFSSSFLLGERARSVRRVSLVSTFFFIPPGNDPILRITLLRSLSFLFSTTHAHKNTQQFYQQQHKHVHLKGTTDMISSVAIPLAMTASAFGMLAMGLKDLATGSNKKPGF